ncbi:MAG TPA: phosphodiester glycosidase family protein [Pseudonocardiaceae bacterium]|nr:phosphodiester glycosidase family protein [Pseudonocardiaceae bacterium]
MGTREQVTDERLSGQLVDDQETVVITPQRPRFWRRPAVKWTRRAVLAALLVFLIVVGASIGGALTAPGTDSTAARLAEWGRDHGLGGIVTWLEKEQYDNNQPQVGGTPKGGIPTAAGVETTTPPTGSAQAGPQVQTLPAPAPIPPVAGAPLPGEGQWQTVVTVKGAPAVRVASLRPDAQHTSFVAGVMWMDPNLVRGQLQPGFQDPGGKWQASDEIAPADRSSVVAVFNAGFRLNASQGGYYSEGRTVVPLQNGAASLVINKNGVADVGSWGSEVHLSPDVASVRQNLVMLVDNGKVNPSCSEGNGTTWGWTLGNNAYIDRSAFGVTASGAEVYVGGPALSVCTLGKIMQDAGVVRGMELDINPDWVSGAYFHDQPGGQQPQGFRLYPQQKLPPTKYFQPSMRDWFGWYARP